MICVDGMALYFLSQRTLFKREDMNLGIRDYQEVLIIVIPNQLRCFLIRIIAFIGLSSTEVNLELIFLVLHVVKAHIDICWVENQYLFFFDIDDSKPFATFGELNNTILVIEMNFSQHFDSLSSKTLLELEDKTLIDCRRIQISEFSNGVILFVVLSKMNGPNGVLILHWNNVISHHNYQVFIMWYKLGIHEIIGWKLNLNTIFIGEDLSLNVCITYLILASWSFIKRAHSITILSSNLMQLPWTIEITWVWFLNILNSISTLILLLVSLSFVEL